MGSLQEDIKAQSDWIVKAFAADSFILNGTIDSFIEIDRFFLHNLKDGKAKTGGRLDGKGYGSILFSIGSYVGETIIKNVPGAVWFTDDEDPQGEITVSVKFPDGTEVWPVERVIKRFQNGDEDSIYPYGYQITKDFTKQSFNERFWRIMEAQQSIPPQKPWWKFW